MPLIQCTGCAAAFKVELKTIGKTVKCPKCRTAFVAEVRRSGPRVKQKSQGPYWIAGTAVLILVAVLVGTLMKKKEPPNVAEADAAAAGAGALPDAGGEEPAAPPTPEERERDRGNVQDVVELYLSAIRGPDERAMQDLLGFPAIQDARAADGNGKAWNDLDGTEAVLARGAIVQEYLGDEETREWLGQAEVKELQTPEIDERRARVYLLLGNLVDQKTRQERNLDLLKVGSRWLIVGQEVGPIEDPEKVAEAAELEHRAATRRRRPPNLGEIARVENTPDTTPDLKARMDGLVAKVGDLNLTREASKARRELVEIGKPAIPALLNLIADHDDLEDLDNQQVINLAVQGLQEITQENFGFAPAGRAAALGGDEESGQNMETALQKWFGWWARYKDTWTQPVPKDDDSDG